jgi:dynein light intermediate chain
MSVPQITHSSLIKFSTPVLVSTSGKRNQGKNSKENKSQSPLKPTGKKLTEENRTEDILNEIIPPKEHLLPNGQLWIQTVLSTPATRTEVIALKVMHLKQK